MTAYSFEYPFTTNLHDIDAAGLMFFAHYYRHAHDAYEAFMRYIGWDLAELITKRTPLPLVHSEADFLLPVRHGEDLTINLTVERLGGSSFTIGYRFINQAGEDSARLRTTHVMMNAEDCRPVEMPETLHQALSEYAD